MIHYSKRIWILSCCLAGLAGFVDAIGFISLGGFFVSFMTGNSTRLGVGISNQITDALFALSLIALFVGGVVAGTILGRWHGRPIVSLWLVVAGLIAAGTAHELGAGYAVIPLIVLAMGAENTVFQRNGEVSIGLTYMTGTLVKLGQWLATAITGGPRTTWAPYVMIWASLVAGAALGALAYAVCGMHAIWIAAAWSLASAMAGHARIFREAV